MNTVVLLLGGNLGNVQETFSVVKEILLKTLGKIQKSSSCLESEPWGFTHENNFTNQVLVIDTPFTAQVCLEICLEIENTLGRTRTKSGVYEARIIDIDILYYNSEIINTDSLTVPHPLMHTRRFTMIPLSEVSPNFVHPVLLKTNIEILNSI